MMGCSTSLYTKRNVVINGPNPVPDLATFSEKAHQTNSAARLSDLHIQNGYHSAVRLQRNKVLPSIKPRVNGVPSENSQTATSDCADAQTNSLNFLAGRLSPADSERTERSVKRVGFKVDPQQDRTHSVLSGTYNDRKRAKRKRERVLQLRLQAKMREAESMSERLMLENERLSLTSSMSRRTSRTGSTINTQSNGHVLSSVSDGAAADGLPKLDSGLVTPDSARHSLELIRGDEL